MVLLMSEPVLVRVMVLLSVDLPPPVTSYPTAVCDVAVHQPIGALASYFDICALASVTPPIPMSVAADSANVNTGADTKLRKFKILVFITIGNWVS